MNLAWMKDKTRVKCKNLQALSDRFNLESKWVANMIMRESQVKKRAKVLEKFIRIALVSLLTNASNRRYSISRRYGTSLA